MPFNVNYYGLKILQSEKVDGKAIRLARESIIKGFSTLKNLHEVSDFVNQQFGLKKLGTWFCLIKPAKVDSGHMIFCTGYINLTFKRNDLDYLV